MSDDTTKQQLLEKYGFKHLCSLTYENTIKLDMYRSENTGITVCIADVDGPLIHGYFNIETISQINQDFKLIVFNKLVTETFDNDGLPYAVARLILTGSDEIPSYNIFEFLGKRSLVTDIDTVILTDRICFTMTAAGSEGFLTILPIYLDQIFYPALTDSAYLLEVHNFTNKGNAGELYRIAQSAERLPHYNIGTKMMESLYPGNCGCKSVLQGTTKNLRENTTKEKVIQFHQKFFRLENLIIVITGKIQHDTIFQALLPLEKKINLTTRRNSFIRPWQPPIEQLTNSVDIDVNFPSTDETYGVVYVAWRGPSAVTQVYDYRGCHLLLHYLELTNINPLKKHFVERCDLFCKCRTYECSDSVFNIMFMDVPVKHLQLITKKSIVEVLNDIFINGLHMETISILIYKAIRRYKLILEKNSHTEIVTAICKHIIHGNIYDKKYVDQSLNNIREFEKMKNEPEVFFLNLLKTYFIDAPMVVVKGKPSLNEYSKIQEEEKHITVEQMKKLNKKSLQRKENELQLAITKKYKMPFKLLARLPIPGTKSITFHHITRYNTETQEQHSKLDVKKLPLFTYLDDVKTNFVYLQIIMDTSSISAEYKNYIFLLMDVLKRSPRKKDDQLISYDKIVAPLDITSIKFRVNINNMGNHCHSVSLTLQVELKSYEDGVQLCKELLYNTELTAEKLKLSTTRLIDNSEQVEGIIILDALMHIMLYKKDSIPFMCNKFRLNFFSDVKKRLDTEAGQKEVIAEIESVRKTITLSKNMFVHMAVNVDKLTEQVSDVYAPWNKFFSDFVKSERTKPNLIANWKLIKSFENLPFDGCVMGVERMESSFFAQVCPCITDVQHPDLPALIVCLKYFTQADGPMKHEFKDTLDKFYFWVSLSDGLLHLSFSPASNLVFAYSKVKIIVETYSTGIKWKQHLYEKAKSMAILDCINNVRSIKRMIKVSLKYSCNNVPFDYVYDDAQRISAVTMKDLIRVTKTYVKPLFDPKKSKTAIVCNISRVSELEQTFHNMDFNLKVYKGFEELNFNDWLIYSE